MTKKYMVNQDSRENWSREGDLNDDAQWIVTEDEIDRLAVEWDMDKAELLAQVTEI